MCGAGPYLRSSQGAQRPPESGGEGPELLYWERGGSGFALCAVHCLNSLLQGPLVDEVQLAELAHELDQEEAQLLGLAPGEVDAGPSQNVGANGDFSSQVLLRALQARFGLVVVDAMQQDVRDEVFERPQLEAGYVCNLRRHWFAIRSLPWSGSMRWFNLDSRSVEGPTLLDPGAELAALLKSVRAERGTVFVVRGEFPQMAAGLDGLEGHQMFLNGEGLRLLKEEASLALDESVVHRLLDAAKLGKWNAVFEDLKKVEQARGPRYVDALPFPRRFALIHYAAATGREEVVKKLMRQYVARLDLRTSEGVSIEDLALQMNHRGVAELVASERQAREDAAGAAELSPKAVSRCTSRASNPNHSLPRANSSTLSVASGVANPFALPSLDVAAPEQPSSSTLSPPASTEPSFAAPLPRAGSSSRSVAPDVASDVAASLPLPSSHAAAPPEQFSSAAPPPSSPPGPPRALDDAVAHKLLDLAKYGKWDQLFGELATAERSVAGGQRRYVDHFPAPRRYGLVHFAANQGRAEVLKRLIQEFGARSDVKTTDGFGAGDIVATPALKAEVKAVLREAARARK